MAYDAVRAQLDKLLGADRNGPLTDSASRALPHYTDYTVCKHYLLGFCPNDLHIKHRSEPGSCRLLHSESVKAAFEKDDKDGNLDKEKSRWYRALLKDCNAIIADEDHKIRGHARRLQDTYCAEGDLSGLMIRNFDTLKKLGMVRKDAKIKVWNEAEDDDDFVDEGTDNLGTDNDTNPKRPAADNAIRNSDEGDTEGDQDAQDDLDGFGVVKVIPADGRKDEDPGVDEFGRIKNSSQAKPEGAGGNDGAIDANDDDDGDGFDILNVTTPAEGGKHDKPSTAPPEKGNEDKNGIGSDSDASEPASSALGEDRQDEKEKPNNLVGKPGKSVSTNLSSPDDNKGLQDENAGKDSENLPLEGKATEDTSKEGAESQLTPQQIMDKFYEAGKGPDGLMMLDRKQCLRVCACCGGYISLVDAESRLLSHYGGKSHHSLATLREKVVEIEATVEKISRSVGDDGGYERDGLGAWGRREHERNRSGYREHGDRNSGGGWTRRDRGDWRRRGGDSYARSGGGRSFDRGYDRGVNRGYSNNRGQQRGYERDDREGRDMGFGSRRSDDRYGGRDGGRYDGSRKRYRSPSPRSYGNNRRSRRY